jgi:hypothetical protein
MDIDTVTAEVAAAVGLAEGPAGVRDVLRVITRHEPVAVREISRRAELPVPIVAAICNELRKREAVDRARPVRLTAAGRAALTGEPGGPPAAAEQPAQPGEQQEHQEHEEPGKAVRLPAAVTGQCPCCEGRGVVVPDQAAALVPGLEAAAAEMPAARLELDQTHCTVDTKLRRVLRMHEAGALGGQRVILLGDDDLVSLAVAAFAAAAGQAARPRQLTVVDSDPAIVRYLSARADKTWIDVIEHDLREPLPSGLAGSFDVACTDPPYTTAGAELFLSRAVAALTPAPGGHVFFSFGARKPEETLETQRLIADMGLAVRALVPGFNSYLGAGILAGASHLYHLRSTAGSRPAITGSYDGPLYTADLRTAAVRPYRCANCRAVHQVGPGTRWPVIAALKADGCPGCGGTVLRPMARGGHGGAAVSSG